MAATWACTDDYGETPLNVPFVNAVRGLQTNWPSFGSPLLAATAGCSPAEANRLHLKAGLKEHVQKHLLLLLPAGSGTS